MSVMSRRQALSVDYFDYAMRDGTITGNSDQARKYIITFTGDNTAEIDGCGGVTNISKIDDQRAKAILGICKR